MFRAGILLRLLLAVSLVLNGIGGALAGVSMSIEAHAVAPDASDHAGCHEPAAEPAAEPETGDAGDCCDSGPCSCACAQLPQLAATELLLMPLVVVHAAAVGTRLSERPAPALPHLIRPPIA